jgi:hypothetical protein
MDGAFILQRQSAAAYIPEEQEKFRYAQTVYCTFGGHCPLCRPFRLH